jgi:catechol 2,3-dioxygenase-like lactoylglutathione lyase family enzyme
MFWLSRPPYRRWLLAGLVVAVAAYMDLTGPATEAYPFVAAPAAPGDQLQIEWRQVPVGLLPEPGSLPATAWRALDEGVPLVPGAAGQARVAPEGWWALEVDLPEKTAPGEAVLVAIRDPDLEVTGIVVAPSAPGSFGSAQPGMIAVPADHASAVAVALVENRATLLVKP